MLDQRLVRENPTLISRELQRRGIKLDITSIQLIAKHQRTLEEERSTLQANGNQIGKKVGQLIKSGIDPNSQEILALRQKGNQIKQKVALLEEEGKKASNDLREQLLRLPNLPSPNCPDGEDAKSNQEKLILKYLKQLELES